MSVHTLLVSQDKPTYRAVMFVAALLTASCTASVLQPDLSTPVFDHPPFFETRFTFNQSPVLSLEKSALRPLARSLAMETGNLRTRLFSTQRPADIRPDGSIGGQMAEAVATAIPIPRSRPPRANADVGTKPSAGAGDTLWQKITDLFGGGVRLASLTPDVGSFDRSSTRYLGVDDHTAVYDVSARAVYMPGGARFEAHSGLGALRDNPEHVNERDVGATPPAIYDLRQRESLFHGVEALRMTPLYGQDTLGRDGLLTHGYMLGPDGDSNGCVSIKEYDQFLAAFKKGEINRLMVVTGVSSAQLNQLKL